MIVEFGHTACLDFAFLETWINLEAFVIVLSVLWLAHRFKEM